MATNIKRAMLSFSPAKYGGKNTAGTIRVYKEEASQTYEYGAPLVYDTSSEKVELAADTTVSAIGLALTPATGTTSTDVPVLVFNESTILRAPFLNAGAAAAASWAYIGLKYSFVARTDGYGYGIDLADSGNNDWFQVIDIEGADDSTPGYCYVRPLAAVLLTGVV